MKKCNFKSLPLLKIRSTSVNEKQPKKCQMQRVKSTLYSHDLIANVQMYSGELCAKFQRASNTEKCFPLAINLKINVKNDINGNYDCT